MIYRQAAKGSLPMFGNGAHVVSPALHRQPRRRAGALVDAQKGNGEAYLIADEEYVTMGDLVQQVADAMNVKISVVRLPVWPVVATGHIVETICTPFGITPPIFSRRVDCTGRIVRSASTRRSATSDTSRGSAWMKACAAHTMVPR